jgi:hypothetical protein
MNTYVFTQDFQGTINGRTERHTAGEELELNDDDAATLADLGVIASEPGDDTEVVDDTLTDDALKAPPQRVRRVLKKKSAK